MNLNKLTTALSWGSSPKVLLLTLVCLLTLFSAGSALAADIIVDNSCSLQDAISAANSDSPAGNCSAGSGADRILIDPHDEVPGWLTFAPLPPITSVMTIASGDKLYHGSRLRGIDGQRANSFFDVASGGHLTIDALNLRNARAGAGGFLVVRRGGAAVVQGDSSLAIAYGACDNAIYNEGSLSLRDTLIYEFKDDFLDENEVIDPANPNARAIVNIGGSMSLFHAQIWLLNESDLSCGTTDGPASAAAAAPSRPAPECKLEPQLQAGDRAIRRGSSHSNLRAEAGISGERIGRIEVGAVVDIIDGPVEADGYNWYHVTADDELEGWVAEAPARSFNCAYYFVSFTGELPPAAPETIPERQDCDAAEPLVVGGYAIIARGANINYRADAGLGGSRRGTLAPGTVLEILEGPESSDGYEWWNVRNPVEGIEGWLAEGGPVSSGECVRWLLLLETEDDMDESDEMMDDETDTEAPDETMEEDPDMDTPEEETESSTP